MSRSAPPPGRHACSGPVAPPARAVKRTASRLAALGPVGLRLTAPGRLRCRLGMRAAPELRGRPRRLPYPAHIADVREVEFVFEPQDEGGYHVYAPDLPGLHTQGETLDEATENARQALELYVEGLRQAGLRSGPAWSDVAARASVTGLPVVSGLTDPRARTPRLGNRPSTQQPRCAGWLVTGLRPGTGQQRLRERRAHAQRPHPADPGAPAPR